MRASRVRFTLGRVMFGIAACGLTLAVVRQVPEVVLLLVPIIPLLGSLWDVKLGGEGAAGGMLGGAFVAGCLGLAGLVAVALQGRARINGWSELT